MNELPLKLVVADPDQPRRIFSDLELSELKNSIKIQGILTPLIVESNYKKDKYLLIDGERRYRCATELNLERVPVEIIEGPLTFAERTIKRFHIQEQHSNWTELDKARAIYEYKKVTDKTIAEIAQELNLYIPKVHAYLSVTEFTKTGEELITKNKIDFTYLIFLIRVVKFYLRISNFTQEQIEIKLINKILSGIFKNASEFQEYSRMINTEGYEELKKEFLELDDYSFDLFKEKSSLNEEKDLTQFIKLAERFDILLTKILKRPHQLTDNLINTLNSISDKINDRV